MKTILPILFFTVLCLPAFAHEPSPTSNFIDFNAYDNTYGVVDTVGCTTLTAYFEDDSFFGGGEFPVSYTWDFGDGTILPGTDPQPIHTYASPGIYTVTMTILSNKGFTYNLTKTSYIIVGSNFSINLGADTSICNASPLTLDATTPNATYVWNTGSTAATISNTTSGQFYVTADRYGCQATDTINITRTVLSVDLGPDQNLCDLSSITLSAGNAGATYLWSTGETTADITVWDGGDFSVLVSENGCSATDTTTITWQPEIVNNFSFVKVAGCVPADIQFTDSSSACSGAIIGWHWDFGDGTTSNAQNPLHTFTSAAQFPVRLTVTASSGSTLARTKKVIIAPSSVSVNLGADTTICFGDNLTLDAANAGAVYTWSTGESTQQIVVTDPGDYSVSVDVGGCVAKDTITVYNTVAAISAWGFNVGGSCLPVAVTFIDSSVANCGQSIVSWKWNFGDGTTSTARNPVHSYATANSYNVKLTVTASGGSNSTRTRSVTVTNTPFTVDLPDEVKVCRGGSVGLDAGVSGAVYSWSPAAGLSATNIQNPLASPTTDSRYTVSVTKCSVTHSDSVLVSMDSVGKPSITQAGNFLSAPASGTYSWYYEGSLMTGFNTQTIRVDRAGYYKVKIANGTGCVNQSDSFFYVPISGDEKFTGQFRIKISPNPANGVFNVLFSEIPSKAAVVCVYDAAGKLCLVTSMQDHVNRMDLTKFRKGLYFLEIIVNTDRIVLPVALQ